MQKTREDDAPLGTGSSGEIKIKTKVKDSGHECPLYAVLGRMP
jgi:hypothetical protein